MASIEHLDEEAVRAANPTLDDIQGPRAWLFHCPLLLPATSATSTTTSTRASHAEVVEWIDQLVDHQCTGQTSHNASERYSRCSNTKGKAKKALGGQSVQLYTNDFSAAFLSPALAAGYFCFGSELEYPGAPLHERALLNLELCGRRMAARFLTRILPTPSCCLDSRLCSA
jgi:hypothetical protein